MDPHEPKVNVDSSLVDLNRAESIDLLGDCQNAMENAVIIYDNGSQEQQIIKLVSDPESDNQATINTEDPDNIITLHASSEDNVTSTNVDASNEIPQNEEAEVDSDDEETIATFITSSGQQLALYAVEDSEEVFAVAVYDESGAPPENFHFLLKDDVERLIGEGAVKTVKKPSAQKKNVKPAENIQIKIDDVNSGLKIEPQNIENENIVTTNVVNEEQICFEVQPQQESDVKTPSSVKTEKKVPTKDILETIVETIEIDPLKISDKSPVKDINTSSETQSPAKELQGNQSVSTTIKNTSPLIKKNVETNASAEKSAVTQVKQLNPSSGTKIIYSTASSGAKFVQSNPTSVTKVVKGNPTNPTKIVKTSSPGTKIVQLTSPTNSSKVIKSSPPYITKVTGSNQFRITISPVKRSPSMPTKITKIQHTLTPKVEYAATQKIHKTIQPTLYTRKMAPMTQSRTIRTVPQRHFNNNREDNKITYLVTPESNSFIIDNSDDFDSDVEILEQSTVQYILCDESQSDSELTFDELQQSLQVFKSNKANKLKSKASVTPKYDRKRETFVKYTPTKILKSSPVVVIQRDQHVVHYTKSPKKARTKNNILQAHRKIKREVEDPSYEFPFADYTFNAGDESGSAMDTSKTKRCRKQQLTTVNRTDSDEIIIQPATMYSETEDEPVLVKKRGRRKKRASPDPDYNPRKPQKKFKKYNRSVELIEIDVEENDSLKTKGKGSSDKENDIISLEDSEEGDDDEDYDYDAEAPIKKKTIKYAKPMMKCNHCDRNFRKRKVLERHLQICLKVPGNAQKMEEKRLAGSGGPDRRFKCKNCEESFDIAVSLARHVRVVHSPRKKGRPAKSRDDRNSSDMDDSTREDEDDDDDDDDDESEPEYVPKRRGRPPGKKNLSSSKVENSSETPSQPRKRGRPPLKKNLPSKMKSQLPFKKRRMSREEMQNNKEQKEKDESPTPNKQKLSEDESFSEGKEDDKVESSQSIVEVKKRGRPPKDKSIKEKLEESDSEPTDKLQKENKLLESSESEEQEDKVGSSSETLIVPKKRGRPPKNKSIKDDKIESSDTEAIEKLPEPRKRGRPPKDKTMKKNKTEDSDEELKNISQTREKKESLSEVLDENQEDIVGSSSEATIEPKKRGRPPKDKTESSEAKHSKDKIKSLDSELEDEPLNSATVEFLNEEEDTSPTDSSVDSKKRGINNKKSVVESK